MKQLHQSASAHDQKVKRIRRKKSLVEGKKEEDDDAFKQVDDK